MVEGAGSEILAEEGLVHVGGGHGGRQGQVAAGDALAQAHQVGPDPAQLAGEQRAGAAESCGHLVAYQRHAPGLDRRREGSHLLGVGHQHPGRALDQGLDDGRGQTRMVLVDRRDGLGCPVTVVVSGGAYHREPQRVEQVGAEAAVPHRQRPDRVSVVGLTESQVGGAVGDPLVVPVLEGDLDGLFHCGRAVRREQEVGVGHRHHVGEGLGQGYGRGVAVAEQGGVADAVELLAGGPVQVAVGVSEGDHPQRRDGVEVTAAVRVVEVVALAPFHYDRRGVLVDGHLGEAVPHRGGVPPGPPARRGLFGVLG